MSVEAPDRGPDSGRKQATPEVPAFSRDYVQQLHKFTDNMETLAQDDKARERTEKKIVDMIYKTLNSNSNSFLLVKSEIAKTNFLNGQESAFITEPVYKAFAASPEGRAFFSKVIRLGTQALENEYTNGYQEEQKRFERAQNSLIGFEDTPRPNGDPTEKLIYQISEMLGKDVTELTFDEAVKSGMMGIKPPSLSAIVKQGLTALEYANPRTDRQRYNEIQRRKRKVESYQVADVLATTDADSLYRDKGLENYEKMKDLNNTRKSLDNDVRRLVEAVSAKKDGDLRFYTIDGQLVHSTADLSFRAKKMPTIVVALGAKPIATLTVGVRNGRTGFELKSDTYTDPHNFFDANVKKDRQSLLWYLKDRLQNLNLPDKTQSKPAAKPKQKPALSEDSQLKWLESLKENAMDLTEANVQKLIKALREVKDYSPDKRAVQLMFNYQGKKAGLGILRQKLATGYSYMAGYRLPPAFKQKNVIAFGPEDASQDNQVGSKLYKALVDSIAGKEPAAEMPDERKMVINTMAKMLKNMDEKSKYAVASERSEQVKFDGRDAKLTIRKELLPAGADGVDKRYKGEHMGYTVSLMFAKETKVYSRRFITDRPIHENWEELGAKLYKDIEDEVDKKKK